MSEPCRKGCRDRAVRVGLKGLMTGSLLTGLHQITRKLSIPPEIARSYRDMTAAIGAFSEAPTLELHDTVHGVGGFFIPDQWAIIVGLEDQRVIARHLRTNHWSEAVRLTRLAMPGHVVVTEADVVRVTDRAAILRCVAHELGHAIRHVGFRDRFPADEEAGADYWAGRLSAVANLDGRFGEFFFHAIGCTGASCTHPAPMERARAFATGYREQRAA